MIWKWNFFLLAICTICADPLGTEGRGKEDGKERRRCSFVIFTVISYFTTRVCSFEKCSLYSLCTYMNRYIDRRARFDFLLPIRKKKRLNASTEILCFFLSILGFESFQSSFENSRIWNPRLVFCICSPRTSCQTAISSDQGQFYTLQSRKRFHYSPAPLTWFSILRPFSRSKYHS